MIHLLLGMLMSVGFAHETPKVLREVKFEQKIGSTLDTQLKFHNESGQEIAVASLKNRSPSIFVFSYGDCKTLCSMVLNGLIKGVNGLQPGSTFNVYVLSIDPKESQENIRSRKSVLSKRLLNKNSSWTFFTASESNIQKAAEDLGFSYRYDEKSKQYAHASGIVFLTPDLKVSSYLMGVTYDSFKIKDHLRIAGLGEKGNFVEELLLYCFHYDPEISPYGVVIVYSLRIAGFLTLVGLAVLLLSQKRRSA